MRQTKKNGNFLKSNYHNPFKTMEIWKTIDLLFEYDVHQLC